MKKTTIILSALILLVGSICGQVTTNENGSDSLYNIQERFFSQRKWFDSQLEQFYSTNVFKPQDLELYGLWDLEPNINRKVGFISLSDNYPLSEHPDSLAIPDLSDMKEENMEYFKLSPKYRKRFLSKTKISETDKVFVYDYSTDVLLSFPVKDLSVVAYLNIYMSTDQCRPCDQYDYMIGFEIDKSLLKGLSGGLVYVGKENPFVQGQMKPIIWKKINLNDFPFSKAYFQTTDVTSNVYLYESNEFQYFIQDFVQDVVHIASNLWARHLLVIDKKNGERVVERMFLSGEYRSIAPLNFELDSGYYEQWTGKLFKNKPPVVFGFMYDGCLCFILLDSTAREICINCDNRH